MNKRGLFGKIFLILFICLILIIAIIGITIYQVFSFIGFLRTELSSMDDDLIEIGEGDCSKINVVNLRMNNIKEESREICKNPLIKAGLESVKRFPFDCNNIDEQFKGTSGIIDLAEEGCSNNS